MVEQAVNQLAIVFDNSSRKLPFESDEVSISREVNKKGQSAYRINDSRVTRSQIISVLNEIGIGPKSYSFIKQGEIARFVDMNDTERLEIIKDISGISIYEDKKDKALKELESVELKLRDARHILKAKEDELRKIDREKKQAEKYNQLDARLKTLKASVLNKKIKILDDDINSIQSMIARINNVKAEVVKSVEESERLIQKFQDEFDDIVERIQRKGGEEKARLEKELINLQNNKLELKTLVATNKKMLIALNKKKEDLEQNITSKRTKLSELMKESDFLNELIKSKEKELTKVRQENELVLKKNDKLFELRMRHSSVIQDILKKKSLNSKIERLSEFKTKLVELNNEKDNILEELRIIENELGCVEEENLKLLTEFDSYQKKTGDQGKRIK